MKNPFRVGDVLYHASLGRVTVEHVDKGYEKRPIRGTAGDVADWFDLKELSFTPWPEPCHVRPVEDGLYVVTYANGLYVRRRRYSGQWFKVDSTGDCDVDCTMSHDKNIFHRISD